MYLTSYLVRLSWGLRCFHCPSRRLPPSALAFASAPVSQQCRQPRSVPLTVLLLGVFELFLLRHRRVPHTFHAGVATSSDLPNARAHHLDLPSTPGRRFPVASSQILLAGLPPPHYQNDCTRYLRCEYLLQSAAAPAAAPVRRIDTGSRVDRSLRTGSLHLASPRAAREKKGTRRPPFLPRPLCPGHEIRSPPITALSGFRSIPPYPASATKIYARGGE